MDSNQRIYDLTRKIRKTPLVLTGIVLQILRNWFRRNSEQFKYNDNDLESKVVIDPSFLWNPENCQNRPGIYIKRGGYIPKGMGKAGTDDLLKIGKHSDRQYIVLPVCPVLVFCISKIPGEVETLAWEASQLLISLSPIIKRDFNFTAFDVERIGEIGKLNKYKEFWTVPIQVTTKFAETWELEEATPILKDTLVNAIVELNGQLESEYGEGDYSSGGYGR